MPPHRAPEESGIAVLMNYAVYEDEPWEVMDLFWTYLQLAADENLADQTIYGKGKCKSVFEVITPYEHPALEAYKNTHTFMAGQMTRSKTIIFSFRGTKVASLRDILNDMSHYPYYWPVLNPLMGTIAEEKDFRVHRGFLKRARGTTDARKGHLVEFPREFVIDSFINQGWTVHFTGHSLGGATAGLITLGILADYMKKKGVDADQIVRDGPRSAVKKVILEKIKCVTFGAPNFGEKGIQKSMEETGLEGVFTHFNHHGDIIHNAFQAVSTTSRKHFLRDMLPTALTDWVPSYVLVGQAISLRNVGKPPPYVKELFGEESPLGCSGFFVKNLINSHFMDGYIYNVLTYMHEKEDHALPLVEKSPFACIVQRFWK